MAITKKEAKASEQIIKAQNERGKNISEMESRIAALKVKSRAAAESMGKAAKDEDLEVYSKAKSEKAYADDAIDLYQERLKSLKGSSLFESESSAMLGKLNAELEQIEANAMVEIIPLLTRAYDIATKAKDNYKAISDLIPVVCEHTEINSVGSTPMILVGVIRSIVSYIDPQAKKYIGLK